jgi:hypothetical protein
MKQVERSLRNGRRISRIVSCLKLFNDVTVGVVPANALGDSHFEVIDMTFLRRLNRKFTSDSFDAHTGQYVSWAVSILVLVLGIYKLTSLPLTETELFFGTLLVFAVMLLVWCLGLLTPIAQGIKQMQKENEH